jgi:Carboxypeptidase regulatory-like domain
MRYGIRMTVTLALAFLAALIAGATATFAQASSSMAELRGQVTDADGAAIANAKLTLTDLVKGSSRVATSDGEGAYVFLGLPPSSYELQVEAQGFSASATRIELTVGRQANIPIKLAAGKIEFQVDVVGGGEVVEVNRTEQTSTVDAKQITSFPINRRNFGKRILELKAVKEFWYTSFHQLKLAEELIDGKREAVRAYLRHFWEHWSGPKYSVDDQRLDHLTDVYSKPGAFTASLEWYRSSGNPVTAYAKEERPNPSDRLATPTIILWQEHDPIFPIAWADQLDHFLASYKFERLSGVGHFTPLEATEKFAAAIIECLEK